MVELAQDFLWLIIALPLGGALLLHFLGRRIGEPRAGCLASLAIAGAFGVAVAAALPFFAGEADTHRLLIWDWMPAIGATFEIQWDPLSAVMTLIVTGVGSLIHVYAVGYMHGDERFSRFFTYLNLFAGSMLTLVMAGNYAMLFMGWELVGLCSYLLISFWFTRASAAAAGKKAFIVNRVGDFGFMIALMLVFGAFRTLSYEGIFEKASDTLSVGMATAIGLLFLLGAAGKSAQIPLYVWLPDAMEGPTPVSALIHAATMVTAGVYVVARSAAIFHISDVASGAVAVVGAGTALLAATIAIAQRDIKRVLAYSTISQLGYMFLGVGVAAYTAGIFHLMTHAFFKALLFLGAGSVIHGMSNEQDMLKMGGLRKAMPVTFATMAIATIAISGIPPFAGFWSKDEILAATFARGGLFILLWVAGLVTALLTAFYMTRQLALVFFGVPRWEEGVHPHESPRIMTTPLLVLALLSIVGGLVNTPFRTSLEHFLAPVLEEVSVHVEQTAITTLLLAGLSVAAGAAGIGMAFLTYGRGAAVRERFEAGLGRLWTTWQEGYGVDEVYGAAIVGPGRKLAEDAAFKFDLPVIDGLVNGVGRMVHNLGVRARPAQTGFVRNYALVFLAGLVALGVWVAVRL